MAKAVAAGRKRVAQTRRVAAKPQKHEEDDVDGCDFEFVESEATSDADLPPAKGGVEELKRKSQTRRRRRA
jgi:hypothetical protein